MHHEKIKSLSRTNALYTNNIENKGQRRSPISQRQQLAAGTCSLTNVSWCLKTLLRASCTEARVQQVRRRARTAALMRQLGHLPLFGQTDDLIRFSRLSRQPAQINKRGWCMCKCVCRSQFLRSCERRAIMSSSRFALAFPH